MYFYDEDTSLPLSEESTIKKCAQEEMIETIKELPKMYQEPLPLFYFCDRSLLEISTSKELPISTVKTRMRRGKSQLKEKVEPLAVINS